MSTITIHFHLIKLICDLSFIVKILQKKNLHSNTSQKEDLLN